MPALLGVFEQPGAVADAARRLRHRGFSGLEIFSPVPALELDEALEEGPSGVRTFTLVGGLAGVTAGYAMTIWMSLDWPIMVGGKPFASIPPYTVIAFELTILLGGLLTLVGLLAIGRLPRPRMDPAYSERFSAEQFGLTVRCPERDVPEVEALLRDNGAVEVVLVEA